MLSSSLNIVPFACQIASKTSWNNRAPRHKLGARATHLGLPAHKGEVVSTWFVAGQSGQSFAANLKALAGGVCGRILNPPN